MQADIEGAVQIVRLAAGFEWSWTIGNLESFCAAVGWREKRRSELGTSYETGLDLERNHARARFGRAFLVGLGAGPEEEVLEIRVLVTDGIEPEDPYSDEDMVDLFAELSSRLADELGRPSRRGISSRPELVWDLPGLVLTLMAGNRLALTISNPAYRRWHDSSMSVEEGAVPSADNRRGLSIPSTWPEFSRALALTLALLPEDGRLSLTASPDWSITFVMDEFHLDSIMQLKSGATAALPAELRAQLVEQGWVEGTNRHGDHWDRSLQWPVRLPEFRQLTDSAAQTLQTIFGVKRPSDLQIKAWATRGENVPTISLLGPSHVIGSNTRAITHRRFARRRR